MRDLKLRFCLVTVFAFTAAAQAQQPSASPAPAAPQPPSQFTPILSNTEFEELVRSAFDLYRQKKYDETLAVTLKATEMRPDDYRPHYIAGAVHMAQGKMKSASDAFAKAIALGPQNKLVYYRKALADRYRNASEDGIAAARKAIELDASFADAYFILGELLSIGNKDNAGAIEAYKTAIKLKPELFEAYDYLGMQLSAAGDKKGAEEIYRLAMAADPRKMASRFTLGRMLVEQGRLAEARTLWEGKAWEKDNTFPNFITVLERAERLKKATEDLAQKPGDPETLLQMGLMVMEGDSWVVNGRQERAIVHFRKALKIKPDFAKAQYAICKAYVQIADTFKDMNKNLDEELAKLKKMDAKLADEIVEYRRTYSGGLRALPANDR